MQRHQLSNIFLFFIKLFNQHSLFKKKYINFSFNLLDSPFIFWVFRERLNIHTEEGDESIPANMHALAQRWTNAFTFFSDVGPTSFGSLALRWPNAWFSKVSQERETFAHQLTKNTGKYYRRAKKFFNLSIVFKTDSNVAK